MEHNVFWSLIGRRTGWVAETVKVYAVCDASGSVKESVHKGLESVPFCVSNLELRQLVFFDILAVHSDQRQGDISTAASRRLFPFLHSVRYLVQSSHQRLEVLR